MNTELVKKRFAKSIKTYDENAFVQKGMAAKLKTMLIPKPYRKVLEIGCGTGFLTNIVSKDLDFETYIANDLVEDCKRYINEINPKIEFVSGDIKEVLNNSNQTFDLIISNAALQWVPDYEEFFNILLKKLNPTGVLLFSTFGKKNFAEIYETIGVSLNYPSKEELKNIFRNYTCKIEEELEVLSFNSALDVLKHIKYTGVNCLSASTWTKSNLKDFEEKYKKPAVLTYNPVYVYIQKQAC